MTCFNFFPQSQTNSDSRSFQLFEQIMGMTHHHHHHHRVYHSQALDLQLGLGSINLGHKRVSEIRSATTLLAPNRLLVQTVVDLNDPVPVPVTHQHQHQRQNLNHFLIHHQPRTQIPIQKKEDDSIPVRAGRPIILGLGSDDDEDSKKKVDDGRLHSLVTGVNGLYECPTCRIEFYSRFSYAAHVKIHHDSETRLEKRMRLHNKYMSKMARRRMRSWTHRSPRTNHSPFLSVKTENQTE